MDIWIIVVIEKSPFLVAPKGDYFRLKEGTEGTFFFQRGLSSLNTVVLTYEMRRDETVCERLLVLWGSLWTFWAVLVHGRCSLTNEPMFLIVAMIIIISSLKWKSDVYHVLFISNVRLIISFSKCFLQVYFLLIESPVGLTGKAQEKYGVKHCLLSVTF